MKYLITSIASAVLLSTSATGEELMNACIGVVEAEGQPEGIAGCECLVDVVKGDEAMTAELLKLADTPAEARSMSEPVADVVYQCFSPPEEPASGEAAQ